MSARPVDASDGSASWSELRRTLWEGHGPQGLAHLAREGQVLVLYADTVPHGASSLPGDLERRVHIQLVIAQATLALASTLHEAGLREVALAKGNATAFWAYPRPALRETVDIDLLVHEHAFDQVLDVLRAAGWADDPSPGFLRRYGERPWEWPMGRQFGPVWLTCDVHRRLTTGRRFSVDHAGVLGRAVAVKGSPLPLFHPEDALLHACLHAATSNYAVPLKSWIDIARLAVHEDVSLARCAERAKAWRMQGPLWAALRVVQRWFGVDSSPAVLGAVRPGPLRRRLLDGLLSGDQALARRPGLRGWVAKLVFGPLVCDSLARQLLWLGDVLGEAGRLATTRLPAADRAD